MLTPSDFRKIEEIRCSLVALRREADDIRRYLALKANFNPNQPRVPAGNPDGGQWTGAGGSGAAGRGPSPGRAAANAEASSWRTVQTRRREGGTVVEETVLGRDGTMIRSEVSARPGRTGWHERHTVLASDGVIRTFQNAGRTQTVFNGMGHRLSEVRLTDGGFERQPIVQPASGAAIGRIGRGLAGAEASAALLTFDLGLKLYQRLLADDTPGRQAVIAFTARGYRPSGARAMELDFVGKLSREDVDTFCPRHGEVQIRTDRVARAIRRRDGATMTPQEYGTAVHLDLEREIRDLRDPNFRAEVSLLKTLAETGGKVPAPEDQNAPYGFRGSVRIDVFENRGDGTVCVYDIKTGRKGLYPGRSAEIGRAVFLRYPQTQRIIVTEVRPTP